MPDLPYRLGGVDHVVIRAKDIDAMLGFYRDLLGCRVAKHNEPLGLWHLDAGGSMIDLVDMNGKLGAAGGPPPGPGRNVDHIAFNVEVVGLTSDKVSCTPTGFNKSLADEISDGMLGADSLRSGSAFEMNGAAGTRSTLSEYLELRRRKSKPIITT